MCADFGPTLNALVRRLGDLDAVHRMILRSDNGSWDRRRHDAKVLYRGLRRWGIQSHEGEPLTTIDWDQLLEEDPDKANMMLESSTVRFVAKPIHGLPGEPTQKRDAAISPPAVAVRARQLPGPRTERGAQKIGNGVGLKKRTRLRDVGVVVLDGDGRE